MLAPANESPQVLSGLIMARLERNARKPGSWESAPSTGSARLIPLSIKLVIRVKKNDLILVVNINYKIVCLDLYTNKGQKMAMSDSLRN